MTDVSVGSPSDAAEPRLAPPRPQPISDYGLIGDMRTTSPSGCRITLYPAVPSYPAS